ncbi:MAG: E1 ubiquitin-activating protein uba2 [Cirrosporium novae-zelandiae]|nr:MAG: E1 ubiquitin-activating protein uba2 [Cirrosporium novae-zelandiae]
MGRDKFPKQSLGVLHHRIKESRVLMVGAGGIGCELLKNLVLTGFGEVHIVDLDTIDLSNLNRQFLFKYEHIKKSKALVAKETAGKFNPNVKLEAHHANIKDTRFNVDWFGTFNLVFNALDNLEARRHVNKMCLAANIPLIESGTTGFNGQVQVIQRGKTECYDCREKPIPKSFPVCTIRSTPSQPIHCIVWGKSYLFTEIFGTSEADAPDLDHTENSENTQEIENLKAEAAALNKIRAAMGQDDFASKVFNKIYKEDIDRLRGMEDMWKSRKPPEPLDYDEVSKKASETSPEVSHTDQRAWSLEENFVVFSDSLRRLSTRLQEAQAEVKEGDAPAILAFDKDDDDTLDFVAAAANLRSIIFGIETRSKFDIKQMAGNIIPAIATTNAMTAGLCVLQAFKVMKDEFHKAKMVFLERSTARVINTDTLTAPNPDCAICGTAQSRLVIDSDRATLNNLVEDILRLQLGYGEELTINNEIGTIYDPDLDDNLPKKLGELGIKDDTFLTVIDDSDKNPRVNLQLSITNKQLPDDSNPIILPTKVDIARRPSVATPNNEVDGIVNGATNGTTNGVNHKRTAEQAGLDHEQTPTKKGKMTSKPSNDDLVIVDDDHGNGAIVID